MPRGPDPKIAPADFTPLGEISMKLMCISLNDVNRDEFRGIRRSSGWTGER
jgi:hypothetical protein